jgi:DNA/RNA-binding domain of Phe-tRNA-synthetase-like protein
MERPILIFKVSENWQQTYPDAFVGVLAVRDASNVNSPSLLLEWTQSIEEEIKKKYRGWDRASLEELPVIKAYSAYYRRFKKTYHVFLQLESVALKGRTLRKGPALLEVMFSAELKNLLLTAGHDLENIQGEVKLDSAVGDESYQTISGEDKILKPGDMYISDEVGVISSIIYGPDQRTKIANKTTDVLFTVYAPSGIKKEMVLRHLEDLRDGVLLAEPKAKVEMLEVFSSSM